MSHRANPAKTRKRPPRGRCPLGSPAKGTSPFGNPICACGRGQNSVRVRSYSTYGRLRGASAMRPGDCVVGVGGEVTDTAECCVFYPIRSKQGAFGTRPVYVRQCCMNHFIIIPPIKFSWGKVANPEGLQVRSADRLGQIKDLSKSPAREGVLLFKRSTPSQLSPQLSALPFC